MDERFATALHEAFPDWEIAGFADDDPRLNERNGTVPVEFADGKAESVDEAEEAVAGWMDAEMERRLDAIR
jgi:hypothetical protein